MNALPTADQLPADLLEYDQWVCWQTEDRDGKQTKIPINPATGQYASTTTPETWTDFEQARAQAAESASIAGLGFVFTEEDPFVGIDLDHCRDDDGVSAWAADIIDRLDSYTEVSPSGTGYHLIIRGKLPEGPNRRGDIECYETARYFTMTGDSKHDPARPVAERTTELAAVHAECVADDEPDESGASDSIGTTIRQLGSTSTTLDDQTVLEKAMAATNATKFERLWNGSTAGYESHSEADMALCFHLAFWTGGDRMQIDRLFRRSGLMREKWDEVHYADGSTYGEKTVDRAVSRVDEFYEPPSTDPASNESSTENTSRERPQPRRERQSPTSSEPESRVTVSESRLLDVIDRLEARVLQLEAENEALRAQLEDVQQSHEQHRQQRVQEEPTASAETKSLWERIVSRVELP